MTRRSRQAQHLSVLLDADSGVQVVVHYLRQERRYAVDWTDGPAERDMRAMAARHAEKVPGIDVDSLVWRRASSAQLRTADSVIAIDVVAFHRILGDEIRRLRKKRGLTRKRLRSRLQREISLQTLATYELGTRQCSVVRFVEICLALDELPNELIARVHERVFKVATGTTMRLDLRELLRSGSVELGKLREWARPQVDRGRVEVSLDFTAIESLAALSGVAPVDMVGLLQSARVRPFETESEEGTAEDDDD